MKPEWKQFGEEQKPADKLRSKPAKRLVELPGGVIKRETERYGGKNAENRRKGYGRDDRTRDFWEKLSKEKPVRKSSGQHIAELPRVEDRVEPSQELPNKKARPRKLLGEIPVTSRGVTEIQRSFDEEVSRIGKIRRRR